MAIVTLVPSCILRLNPGVGVQLLASGLVQMWVDLGTYGLGLAVNGVRSQQA
jgi:hypothetical protein